MNTQRRLSIALAAVFLLLCALHLVWAFGGPPSYPVIPTADGAPRIEPSTRGSLIAAVGLAAAALVCLVRGGLVLRSLSPRYSSWGVWALTVVFFLRTIGEFRYIGFFKSVTGTDFAVWDTWVYTPIALLLALGCLWLTLTARPKPARPG